MGLNVEPIENHPHPSDAEVERALAVLGRAVTDPSRGLPHAVFLWLSSVTPLVNVDLLIRDPQLGVLLTWRDDGFYGPGWHVPGGIIRFKETALERVQAVGISELGAPVDADATLLCLHELSHRERAIRGHFLSMLFACRLSAPPPAQRAFNAQAPIAGAWAWHRTVPNDLIPVHAIYRPWLQATPPLCTAGPAGEAPPWIGANRLMITQTNDPRWGKA